MSLSKPVHTLILPTVVDISTSMSEKLRTLSTGSVILNNEQKLFSHITYIILDFMIVAGWNRQ
jgi:hypothetical protein